MQDNRASDKSRSPDASVEALGAFWAGYASLIRRLRWPLIALWIVITAASLFFLPNLTRVVAHTQTTYIPNNSQLTIGQNLLKTVDPAHNATSSGVIAISDPSGLTAAEKSYFDATLARIDSNKSAYGVHSIQDLHNSGQGTASSFLSKDHTTEIALIGFSHGELAKSTSEAIGKVQIAFANPPGGAKIYFTGEAPIQQDDIRISQQGVQKTAGVTVVLVLVILLLVFRSVIAPIITLLAIGLSFAITSGVVAFLAQHGFPISTFTQEFLIAIIFGAGTDYSIIMMNRFREELSKAYGHRDIAIAASMKAVTKTVIFSASTVFVSFAVLWFARFGLYRTAVGVAIGVAIVLLNCLTLIPALMSVLGSAMFWPRRPKPGAAHKPSAFWTFTSRIAVRRPWWTLLVLVVVLAPIAMLFTDKRTFDPLDDIPNAPSAVGFRLVSKAFGPGNVMPSQLVLDTTANLRTGQGLTTINNISRVLAGLASVAKVESATRPTGKVIATFELAHQNTLAGSGLTKVQQGLDQLQSQLAKAGSNLSQQTSGPQKLVDGSSQVTSGIAKLGSGLGLGALSSGANRLASGANSVSAGAVTLQQNLQKIGQAMQSLEQGAGQLSAGLGQAASGSAALSNGTSQLQQSAPKLAMGTSLLANAIAQWAKSHPDTSGSILWAQIVQLAQADAKGASSLVGASGQLAQGANQLSAALGKLHSGATSLQQGLGQVASDAPQLAGGAGQLATGAKQVASGSAQLGSSAAQATQGASALAAGSAKVTDGVRSLASAFDLLSPKMNQAGAGVGKLGAGVKQVTKYLMNTADSTSQGDPGFYIPASQVASNAGLLKMMNAYISPNGHVAKFNIVLNVDPYSTAAIADVPGLVHAAQVALAGSPINHATLYATGTTPTQAELNSVSSQDFTRTVALVLGVILILLIVMLRSIITPVYIILSLAGSYLVTMGLLQNITIHMLGKPGLSWPTPFFIFLLLVALGVDYSIFLMSRFEEEMSRGLTPRRAIQIAMGNMGGVIFSAALIMAGTFGSMAVAGVSSLMEIGISVIIGLLLYFAVFLGFFVPACTAVFGWAHYWPFVHDRKLSAAARRARGLEPEA